LPGFSRKFGEVRQDRYTAHSRHEAHSRNFVLNCDAMHHRYAVHAPAAEIAKCAALRYETRRANPIKWNIANTALAGFDPRTCIFRRIRRA
jgi:hypothetical protein